MENLWTVKGCDEYPVTRSKVRTVIALANMTKDINCSVQGLNLFDKKKMSFYIALQI